MLCCIQKEVWVGELPHSGGERSEEEDIMIGLGTGLQGHGQATARSVALTNWGLAPRVLASALHGEVSWDGFRTCFFFFSSDGLRQDRRDDGGYRGFQRGGGWVQCDQNVGGGRLVLASCWGGGGQDWCWTLNGVLLFALGSGPFLVKDKGYLARHLQFGQKYVWNSTCLPATLHAFICRVDRDFHLALVTETVFFCARGSA